MRVTFTGDDLDQMAPLCLDRRIKLVFPLDGVGISDLTDAGDDWYTAWRQLPDERRNPLRTYTARDIRLGEAELDVDFVSHGVDGPASAWANRAQVGDELLVVGADGTREETLSGIEWRPGAARTVLLGGDETAAPAICSILSSLDADACGQVFIEVPTSADVLPVDAPSGVSVTWLARDGAAHGSRLDPALRAWVRRVVPNAASAPAPLDDIDLDSQLVWETPDAVDDRSLYVWLAGEANVIKTLRRFLVQDAGIDRGQVAFMGYWRRGHAERG